MLLTLLCAYADLRLLTRDGRDDPALRVLDPCLQEIVEESTQHSASFARLIDRVTDSDLIVYLDLADLRPRGVPGQLSLMTAARRASVRAHRPRLSLDTP